MSAQLRKYKFTVAQYMRMGEVGILTEDERVELLEGEIFKMPPVSSHHAGCVGWFTHTITILLHRSVIVRTRNPVHLDDYSEPVPDVALVKRRDDFYKHGHPRPEDVLLLIEVSDSTLEYDRRVKVPIYARAGVAEVWIVNLVDERVETFAGTSRGAYQKVTTFSRGEEVRSR